MHAAKNQTGCIQCKTKTHASLNWFTSDQRVCQSSLHTSMHQMVMLHCASSTSDTGPHGLPAPEGPQHSKRSGPGREVPPPLVTPQKKVRAFGSYQCHVQQQADLSRALQAKTRPSWQPQSLASCSVAPHCLYHFVTSAKARPWLTTSACACAV